MPDLRTALLQANLISNAAAKQADAAATKREQVADLARRVQSALRRQDIPTYLRLRSYLPAHLRGQY